ncbi:uncharacterized protein LOC114916090 [Cajanus cajan]|uniref:uncharacterized protein LOC114916090 n=1 Tax=Cajanus cajan TaxID=3821 RepID=UPI0010FBBCE8|nr:uncharacterized protein LOC114916090 [Cajanus cajan]
MASIDQKLNLVVAQPISVVKDPDLFDRLKKAFVEQIKKVKRRTLENLQHDECELSVPAVPTSRTKTIENDNVDETSNKAQFKRGRKTTTKLLLEIPFSFEHPPFCFKENIDLEKVIVAN